MNLMWASLLQRPLRIHHSEADMGVLGEGRVQKSKGSAGVIMSISLRWFK